MDTINATEIYNPTTLAQIKDYVIPNGYFNDKAFNMYVFYDSDNIAFDGEANILNTFSAIKSDLVEGPLPVHLIGHNFNLANTFRNSSSNDEELCEHVTRDEEDEDFNAETHGDYIVDTAAQPAFINSNPDTDDDFDELTCEYIGLGQDCQESDYEIFTEDVRNFMSYTHDNSLCLNFFSIGQYIRIREAVEYDPQGRYDLARGSLSSLYDPYKGVYTATGGVILAPTFQPGFDYEFLDCGPEGAYPLPSDFGDTSFSYTENGNPYYFDKDISASQFSTITHSNKFTIRINQLNQRPEKCWNKNNQPIFGLITQFNDGVFNTNVTLSAQDSLQINNSQMIENLNPGLYSIHKTFDNGSTEENVILKNNQ